MKQVTKKRRNEIYRKAMNDIFEKKEHFICHAIGFPNNIDTDKVENSNMFPELQLFKPKHISMCSGWFNPVSLDHDNYLSDERRE